MRLLVHAISGLLATALPVPAGAAAAQTHRRPIAKSSSRSVPAGHTLSGTLTLPAVPHQVPGIVLIQQLDPRPVRRAVTSAR